MVTETAGAIDTGNAEIDEKLGGGLGLGSLVLLEGQTDAGKSVVCQHIVYRALTGRLSLAYYTTENTVKSLMAQMKSLELDVTDYFLCDRLRVYPLLAGQEGDGAFEVLLAHLEALPAAVRLIIVDSLSGLPAAGDERGVLDFFDGCRRVCGLGKTVMALVNPQVWEPELLAQVHSRCDAHLSLRLEEAGERLVKVLEVTRLGGVEQEGNSVGFEIEPGPGLRVLAVSGQAA